MLEDYDEGGDGWGCRVMRYLSGREQLCFLGVRTYGMNYRILEKKTEELSRFRRGPDETYQDFVAHLLQVVNCPPSLPPPRQGFSVLVNCLMVDVEAGILIVKQLAYENANAVCQTFFHPFRKNRDSNGSICLCADIGPGHWTLPVTTYYLTISVIIGLCHHRARLLCGF